jgi:hypothetical protein
MGAQGGSARNASQPQRLTKKTEMTQCEISRVMNFAGFSITGKAAGKEEPNFECSKSLRLK